MDHKVQVNTGSRYARTPKRLALFWLAGLAGLSPVLATDGQPILDLGLLSWVDFQKKQLLAGVAEIDIRDQAVIQTELEVEIYQAVVFMNHDKDKSHRLVFTPSIDNLMEAPYTSAVLESEKRWGLEFHTFGNFPYHCTVHPEERGSITVIM